MVYNYFVTIDLRFADIIAILFVSHDEIYFVETSLNLMQVS